MKKLLALAAAVLLIGLSFYVGPTFYSMRDFMDILQGHADESLTEIIVVYRGTRTLVAILVGVCVATSGLMLQQLTRNTLASPSMMALNAGAALFVSLALGLGLIQGSLGISLFAMLGTSTIGISVYFLALRLEKYHCDSILILVGSIVGMALFGVVQLMMILDENMLRATLAWLFGSFNNRSLQMVLYTGAFLVLTFPLIWYLARHLDILQVSDTMAQSLGANIGRIRGLGFFVACGLSGMSVALAGPVSFIGLLVPQLTRLVFRQSSFRAIVAPNMIVGVALALAADILSRLVLHPQEVPIGIVLSVVGAPFLLYVLYQRQKPCRSKS